MNTCYNPFSLDGKTILVTGASSGIGRAVAIECAAMGAQVIITARNEERLKETAAMMERSDSVRILTAELCDLDSLKQLVDQLPLLDGMVLCAGINETVPVQFCTPKKFTKMFNIDFFAPAELVRLIQKSKKINAGGSIVTISSAGGNFAINIGNGMYGAAKSALSTWCKFLAQEMAVRKIRVNTICPGMVNTPMIASGTISDEQLALDREKYLLKRFGDPQEIALACIYFLSDASSWVTGTDFLIDGGYNLR